MSHDVLESVVSWMGQGFTGRALARQYTAHMDDLITGIFKDAGNPENLLLLATGGYGRRELAPFSDIDIMFYAPNRDDAAAAEKILYRLWDEKIDISHAFRTPKECLDEANKDVRTRTTLLESRYLAGSRRLYEQFRRDVYPAVAFRKQKQFITDKLMEMEKRHISAGDSIYLLEPHIKEGDGGLRDIHTILWLSKVAYKIEDVEGLRFLISPHDHRRLLGAYDFMIQARFCLHLECKRRNDILSFEYQKTVAACLGFRDTRKFSGAGATEVRFEVAEDEFILIVGQGDFRRVSLICARERYADAVSFGRIDVQEYPEPLSEERRVGTHAQNKIPGGQMYLGPVCFRDSHVIQQPRARGKIFDRMPVAEMDAVLCLADPGQGLGETSCVA